MGNCASTPYKRKYPRSKVRTTSEAVYSRFRDGDCAFFKQARAKIQRDYILVVDRSGSMRGSNWVEAEEAVRYFARHICEFDSDGITLIFFDNEIIDFQNVKDPDFISQAFQEHPPRGSTNLAGALHTCFLEHFGGTRGATTVLVITDGVPDSRDDVAQRIKDAANSITSDEELSVSIIQVGGDRRAREWLRILDDELECAFDIVDVVVPAELIGMTFEQVIQKSLAD
jgi:Mg-chelatase subunit ChlD